ncbi:unnamed protein product [Choristocarpus tenellus]
MTDLDEAVQAGMEDLSTVADSNGGLDCGPDSEEGAVKVGARSGVGGEHETKKSSNKKKGKKKGKGDGGSGAGRGGNSGEQSGSSGEGAGDKGNSGDRTSNGTSGGVGQALVPVEAGIENRKGVETSEISNDADMIRFLRQRKMGEVAQRKLANMGPHKFWDTQPMKKVWEEVQQPGEIETKTAADVREDPYNMPAGFEWCHVDVMDETQAEVGWFEPW